MQVLYPDRIGIWNVSFPGVKKTGEPGENPSEQGQEPTTNSSYLTIYQTHFTYKPKIGLDSSKEESALMSKLN